MLSKRFDAIAEIAIYCLLQVIAAAVFWASLSLPASLREPLGSASIPQGVAVIVAILSLILMVKAVVELRSDRAPEAMAASSHAEDAAPPAEDGAGYRRRYDLALAMFVMAIAFTVVLEQRWIRAEILAPTFLCAAILILNRFRPRSILPALVVGVGVGLAATYVFKNFFYIDLP